MSKQSVNRRDLLKTTGTVAVLAVSTSGIGSAQATPSAVADEELVPADDIDIVSPSLVDYAVPRAFNRGDVVPITLALDGGNVGTVSLTGANIEAHTTVHDSDGSGEATLYLNTYQFGDENRNHGFFTRTDDDGVELVGNAESSTPIDGGSAGGAVLSGGGDSSGARYRLYVSPGTEPHTAANSILTDVNGFVIGKRATDGYTFWAASTTPGDLTVETVAEFEEAIDGGQFQPLSNEIPDGGVLAIDVAASGLEGILHEAAIRDEDSVAADVLNRADDNLVTNPFLAATEQTIDDAPLLMANLESTEVGTETPVELDFLPGVVDVIAGTDEFDRLNRYVLLIEVTAGPELVTEGVTLKPGQTFDTTVSVEPSGGELEGNEDVITPLGSESAAVAEGWTLVPGSEFVVTTTEPVEPTVGQGETLTISSEVENIGDMTGTLDIMLEIGDVTDTQSVTLNDGEADTVEFTVDTGLLVSAEYDYTIQTPTDEATNTATIGAPAELFLSDLEPAETTVEQGSSVPVTATVENVGDVPATGEVILDIADITAERKVDLDGGEADTVEFTVDTEALTPDEYVHTLETTDDELSGTLVVNAATDKSDEDAPNPDEDENASNPDEDVDTADGADTNPVDDEGTGNADDDGPGFGVGGALAGLGGVGYLLKRQLNSKGQEEHQS